MGPSAKWIDGLTAETSVDEAARRSLDARLSAVNYWLPPGAYLADRDIEHVHRLRVSTRRAVAALRLYRGMLRRGPERWMKKRLKKIRRAAGEARDLDVLAQRLVNDYGYRAEPVRSFLAMRRAEVQPAIVKVAERSRRDDRFVRKAAKLTAGIRPAENGQPIAFGEWAAKKLDGSAERFFAALPENSATPAELHQFRIRAKSLRYTIELVAAAFGPELRDESYQIVEQLQERLGKVQDHVTAAARLREWTKETDDCALQQSLRELAAEEGIRLDGELREFWMWWTPERVETLRNGLGSCSHAERGNELPGELLAECDGQFGGDH